MFLKSLLCGLGSLKNPYVVLLLGCWVLLNMAYLIALRLATSPKETEGAAAPGCLTQILGILFQGFLMGLFILLLLPILLGLSTKITFTEVQSFALLASRAGILSVLAMTLLSFLPGFGRFLARSPGLEAFLAGTIIFRLIAPLYMERVVETNPIHLKARYPNFWESLAYLALALVFCQLLSIGIKGLQILCKKNARIHAGLQNLLGPSLDILGGILPLLMYIHYVRLSLGLQGGIVP